jgi:hypothetical protein
MILRTLTGAELERLHFVNPTLETAQRLLEVTREEAREEINQRAHDYRYSIEQFEREIQFLQDEVNGCKLNCTL